MKQLHRRVVVTGLGILSPIGNTVDDAWRSCIEGKSGITTVDIGLQNNPVRIGGRLKNFDSNEFLDSKEVRRIDPFIQYGIIAANFAIKDSGIDNLNEQQKLRIGVSVGSGIGGLETIQNNAIILKEKGPRKISPFFVPASLINLLSGQISIKHGFKGPNHSVVTACATGAHSIGDAAEIIKRGAAASPIE
jgi:3-oxoacyl-[acyl-carrier-protein] synthase II